MTIWLTKLLLSHLVADFLLQKKTWIDDRNTRHLKSGYLYLHTLIAAGLAWLFIGFTNWIIPLIIFITHTLIDAWKSYRKDIALYFIIDQCLHLLVIFACAWFTFYDLATLRDQWYQWMNNELAWIQVTAFVFLAWPSGFLIGYLTRKWRTSLDNSVALENAGKWIGIIERLIILVLVLNNQFAAVGLLVAAKGIIRFSEPNRPEQKTEYLLIGTLISIGLAIITGLIVQDIAG